MYVDSVSTFSGRSSKVIGNSFRQSTTSFSFSLPEAVISGG
jgi:hypothetical protein